MRIPTLIVLSGVPRSGKTTLSQFLRESHGFIHVSADALRSEYGMEWGTVDAREAFINNVVQYRVLEALVMQKDVVVDSTAMYFRQRQLYFELVMYALGKLHPVKARKVLLSLDVAEAVWEQRVLESGRNVQCRNFFFDRFHPVGSEEAAALDLHLRFDNNTPADLEHIKARLTEFLQA
jgi:predicted kinase